MVDVDTRKKKKKSHLFTVESAPDTQAHAPQDFFQLNGWSQLGGNKGGRGRKREEETPAEGVWQSSDGGMGRERGALNLLEEEVWRKGLGKTERGVSLTWPPCLCLPQPIQALFTHTHMHSSPPLSWRSPWVWAKKPPGCQGLPEKALTDVMIQSAQIFPLSFSRSGSEETDRANIRGGGKKPQNSELPSVRAAHRWEFKPFIKRVLMEEWCSKLTIRCKVKASWHFLCPEVLRVVSRLANFHLCWKTCDYNFSSPLQLLIVDQYPEAEATIALCT